MGFLYVIKCKHYGRLPFKIVYYEIVYLDIVHLGIVNNYLSYYFSDGFAFSQEENGVVSQSQIVRSYDTTKQRSSIEQ